MEVASSHFSTQRLLFHHSACAKLSCKGETRILFSHSDYSPRFYEGYNTRRLQMKKAFLRSNFSMNTVLFSRGYLHGVFCYSSSNLNNRDELEEWCKMDYHNVVRSELPETSFLSNAHSLTEWVLNPKIRATCFYAITALLAIFLVLPMIVAHPFVLLFDQHCRRFHHFIARIWAYLTVALFCKFKFEGLENLPPADTSAVYVSNHQSFLDIYTLLTLGRNFKFISKASIFLFPVVGWAMLMMGIIPLKRMDSRSQMECLKHCIHLVNKGASVFFFPEGTRSRDGALGVFKKGAFTVAAKTGAPVVPITLIGTGKIMPAGMENVLNAGSVRVIVHEPIKGACTDKLCDDARIAISAALDSRE